MPWLTDFIRRNVLLSCDHGSMIVNRFDQNKNGVGQSSFLLDHGNASTVEVDLCMRALDWRLSKMPSHDPVIWDVGANIGTWTTWMAKWFTKSQIHAFEPQHQIFQILCGNCAINNIFNVTAHPTALGQSRGSVVVGMPDYNISQDFGLWSMVDPNSIITTDRQMTIHVDTIDNVMQTQNLNFLDLVKLDAEGMDLQILRGGLISIAQHRPCLFVEYDNTKTNCLDEIKDLLTPFGYTFNVTGRDVLATVES